MRILLHDFDPCFTPAHEPEFPLIFSRLSNLYFRAAPQGDLRFQRRICRRVFFVIVRSVYHDRASLMQPILKLESISIYHT